MRSLFVVSVLTLLVFDYVQPAPQPIGRLLKNSSFEEDEQDISEPEPERSNDTAIASTEDRIEFSVPEEETALGSLIKDTSSTNNDDLEVSSIKTSLEILSQPVPDENSKTATAGTTTIKQNHAPFSTTFRSTESTEPLPSSTIPKETEASFVSRTGDPGESDNDKVIDEENIENEASFLTTLPHRTEPTERITAINSEATKTYDSIDYEEESRTSDDNDDNVQDEGLRRLDELVEEIETEEAEHHSTLSSLPSTYSEEGASSMTPKISDELVHSSEELQKNSDVVLSDGPIVDGSTTVNEDKILIMNTSSTTVMAGSESLKFRNEKLEKLIVTSDSTEKTLSEEAMTLSAVADGNEFDDKNEKPKSGEFSSNADVAGLRTDQDSSERTTLGMTTMISESTAEQNSPVSLKPIVVDHLEERSGSISSPPPDVDTGGKSTEEQDPEEHKVSDGAVSITTLDDAKSPSSRTSNSEFEDNTDAILSSTSRTSVSDDFTSKADDSSLSTSEMASKGLTTLGHQTLSSSSAEPTISENEPQPIKNTSETSVEARERDDFTMATDMVPQTSKDLDTERVGTDVPEREITPSTTAFETTKNDERSLELKNEDVMSEVSETLDTDTPVNERTTTSDLPTMTVKESTPTTRGKPTTLVWRGPTVLPRQTTTTTVADVGIKEEEAESVLPEKEVMEVKEDNKDVLETRFSDRYLSGDNMDMVAAVQFLHYHDKASSEQCFKLVDAHWNYATNLTEENKRKQLQQTLEYSLFHKEAWKNATSFAWKSFNDTLLRRWFKSLSILGNAALPEDKLTEFNQLKAEMKNTYSTAKVCSYLKPEERSSSAVEKRKCNLSLEPDLQSILMKSRDYDELVHVWKAWRDAAGKPIRDKFLRFVELSNEAAALNGFPDTGDMWREAYESDSFQQDLDLLWEQLRPLYEHLHAYVRRKLINEYGSDRIKEDGPIPAHLFGNMWAQSWVSLLDITQPFPGKPSVDVTSTMEMKNMTAVEMFKISEEFFTSLGLKPMPEEFWKYSIIEKPQDREIICHASAWDFCNGKDYRIKQCTVITMEDLITVHHEMGHIQYFLQYARQPNVFREGANPGFHEAIGDVLALSVSTPKHLLSIGLLDEIADDPEGDLNFLLRTALEKVSFLPSGYLIDLWRWGLFNGEIKQEEMNTKWWELRLKYQGICPPVKRTEEDFDPGAKYHVAGNVPYIRYFVSFVIQFQFHKVLCDAAGHTGPLYKCDIYRSKEAGQILSQVMELGSSEHWSEAMRIMTGGAQTKMDAQPIMEYFEPLLNWLVEQNKNETLGWKIDDPTICP